MADRPICVIWVFLFNQLEVGYKSVNNLITLGPYLD